MSAYLGNVRASKGWMDDMVDMAVQSISFADCRYALGRDVCLPDAGNLFQAFSSSSSSSSREYVYGVQCRHPDVSVSQEAM